MVRVQTPRIGVPSAALPTYCPLATLFGSLAVTIQVKSEVWAPPDAWKSYSYDSSTEEN